MRYLDSCLLEIDNNACERSLRAVAVGRKKRQFASSLIGDAKLHVIEPCAYATDVTVRQAQLGDSHSDDDLTLLLPDRWIATNPRARLPVGK